MTKAANPFMHYVTDYEKEAEAFLTKHECSDAIDNPRPIPIRDIATRLMSLEIIDTEYLSFDGSVQGAIAFTKGIIEVFDWSAEETIGYEVPQPSIFVDADIMNIGRFNNTLAHECFHWWRHRNYFNYKRNHEKGTEFAFRCNRGISTTGSLIGGQWSDIDKMEWQAKTIAPKILMPRTAFKKKVDHIYQVLLADNPNADRSIVTEDVIDNVADFFEVSRQSAAIRMYELGYIEAEAYCAGEANTPTGQFQHRKATQAKRHQRPISQLDVFKLYRESDLLRATLDTGAFYFSEGYFVLNNDRYLFDAGNGVKSMTPYAKDHLAECTLDFSIKLIPDSFMHGTSQMMFRSDSVFNTETTYEANTQNTELFNKAKDFEKKLKRAKSIAITPAAWMKKRMADEHWYESTFEEKTGLDKMNYSRIQGETHKFTMRPLVAMGVGLGLDLSEMEEVLRLGGMAFTPGDTEQEAYKYLFTAFYQQEIDVCNAFLSEIGVTLLGTQQRIQRYSTNAPSTPKK